LKGCSYIRLMLFIRLRPEDRPMINGPRAGQDNALRRSSSRRATTAALTFLALIFFAANSLFCRLALAGPIIDPASYTAVRLITGAVALWIIVVLRGKRSVGKSGGSWISAAIPAYRLTERTDSSRGATNFPGCRRTRRTDSSWASSRT